MSMPRRRAIEERTCCPSSASPSISLLLSTSSVRVSSVASRLKIEAERLHASSETALSIPYVSQRPGQAALVPMEVGPSRDARRCIFSASFADIIRT